MGSADQELAKYLDSIDGRVQKLQNHLQELAVVNIDSDWIKGAISLIDILIQGVTKLTESLGGINIAIGTILGTITTVKGFGVQLGDQDDDSKSFLGKLLSNRKIVKDEKKNHDKYVTRKAGYQDQSILDLAAISADSDNAYQKITEKWGTFDAFFDTLSDGAQESMMNMWDAIENKSATVGDVMAQGMKDFPEQMSQTFVLAKEEYETGMTRIKGIASTIGSLAINSIISIGISLVTSKLVPAFIDWVDNTFVHHSERIIERGKEAQEAINDMYSEFEKGNQEIKDISISINVENADTNSVQENLDAIAERYVELKKGVNEYTNANKNLTTDQYKEYLELCNKIAQKYPELVKGYDSQGNAILRLGTNVEDCKNELKDLYNVSLQASDSEFAEQLGTAFEGIAAKVEKATNEIKDLNDELIETKNELENYEDPFTFDENGKLTHIRFTSQDQYSKWWNAAKKAYENQPPEEQIMGWNMQDNIIGNLADGRANIPIGDDPFFQQIELMRNIYSQAISGKVIKDLQVKQNEISGQLLAEQRKIIAASVEMVDDINKVLTRNVAFTSLNESLTSAVLGSLGQFDVKFVEQNFQDAGETFKDASNNFIDYIVDLFAGLPDDTQEEIAKILNDSSKFKNLNIHEYMDKIYGQLFEATGENKPLANELAKYLGITDTIRQYLSDRAEIFNVLEPLGMTEEQLSELTLDQIPRGLEIVRSGIIENLDQFYKELEKVNKRPEAVKNGLFSDILNDEEYKNASDAIKEKLTALSTAIETFREKGMLSGDDARALMDQGLNFDYNLDSLNDKSVEYLEKWVSLLHEQADAKKLGTKGLNDLNNYIHTLMESYQGLDISVQDVMNRLKNSNFNRKGVAQRFREDFKKEFEKELGSEEDRKILFDLEARTESANWTIDEWRRQFDNAKLTFHFVADTTEIDKQIEELNKAIERRNNARANVESKQALKQAGGKQLDASDYDDLLAFDQADIDDYTEQYAKVQKKIAYAKKGKGTYWEMLEEQYNQEAQTIETQLNNAQQKQIQDLYAKQNAPLDAIKKQFTEIQREAEATQQEITKLENVGKSATAEQYEALIGFSQAQISNLQEQKQFQLSLMEWLASNEDFGIDSEFYTQAQDAVSELDSQLVQAYKDMSDTKAKLDEVYSSTSFEYLLTNKDSDKSVTQIYQKFEGFISRYKGYIDQIKNGEKIDFDDLIASDAEFAGVDNIEKLKERIGELSAEKLVDFVNDFSNAISGLDRDSKAFQKASSFITQAIMDIDFKNIDINAEAVQQLITDKIFSTEALKGRDNYKAAAWGQEVYAAVNNAIEDGADLASFIKVVCMPGFYEMTPDEVIAQMGDIKAGVELEITNKEQFQQELAFIEAEMANAQAHQENTEQKRNREESQGNYENSEQYIEDEKENIRTQIKDLEKQKADLYKKENENYARLWDGSLTLGSNEYNALIKQRDTEATNFQTQIDKLKNSIEDLDFEKLLVGANEYDQAIEKYKTSNQKFMTELGKYDEYTEVPDSLFKSIETNLYNQSEQYRLKKEFYEGLLGLDDGITEYQRTLIEGYITETEGQYQSLINEMNEYITKQLTDSDEKDLAMLKSRKSVLQNKQQDKTMTTKDYEELDEIDQQIELIYGDIVKKLTDFINDESTDPLLKNAAEVMLNSFQEELNNITIERNKNEDAKQLLPIQGMEKNLAAMVEGGDKVKKEISDIQDLGEELVPDSLYGDLETWANAQLFWIEKIRDAYLLLADAEKNPKVAQQYRDAAEALTEKVDNANEDIRQAKQGVEDNYLNSLKTEAQIIGDQMDDIREKLEDTGRVASVEDYNEALKIVGSSIENLNKQHDYWKEKLDGVNEGTTLWETYKSNLDGVDSNLKAATDEQEKFNKAIRDIKINDIQNKIDEYNNSLTNLQNDIKMNEAKGINKSMEDFLAEDEFYDKIIEEANNLKKKLDLEYFAKLFTFAEDEDGNMVSWKGSQDYKDLVAQRAAAAQAIWDAEYNKEQNKHEKELLPIKQLQDELKELQLAGQYTQREYDNIVAAGGELSDEQYQVQLTNLGEQREKLEEIERRYQQLADQHKGDAFGLQMLEALDGVQSQIDAIDDQELDINVQIDNRELTHLQNDMTVLQRDAERLKEKLDGTEAPATKGGILGQLISNNQEQMQNLAKQVVEYQEQMNKIKNEDKKYAVNKQYIQLSVDIATAESNMNQLISSTMEYKKALEQLPIDRINQTIAGNEAKLGYEEAKRNNASAQGEVLGEDDYAITLRALESNLDARRKALEIAKTNLENAEHNYDETGLESDLTELQNARTAFTTAQTEATEAETSYINAQNEANSAALNQHERRLAELDNRRAELEMAQQVLESLSGERSSQNIADEYRVANDIKKELEAELTTLEENPLSDAFENEQKRLGILKLITAEETTINNLIKESAELPAVSMKKTLEKFQEAGDGLQKQIQMYQKAGKEVPDEILETTVANLNAQISQNANLRDFYNGLANTFSGSKGLSTFFKGIADGYQDAIDNLTSEKIDTQNMIDEKGLTHLGYEMDDLKKKGEELQEVLNKEGTPKFVSDYEHAIENAIEQNENLSKQAEEVRENLVGLKFDDPNYQTYMNQLDEIHDAQQANIDSIREWQTAINMLNFNRASEGLSKYIEGVNKELDKQSNRVSLGYRMTQEDLLNNRSSYLTIRGKANNNLTNIKNRMDEIEVANPSTFMNNKEFQELQTLHDEQIALEEEYKQKIEEINKEIVWFPVEEMQREQKEIQRIYGEITRSIEELNQNGFQTPEYMLTGEIGAIDNESANLEAQRDKMIEIRDKFAAPLKLFGWYDEIQDQIDDVGSQLDALEDKKREIQIEIDTRPIQNYENYLGHLDSEADVLNDKLDHLETSDMSEADILAALEENARKRRSTIHNELIEQQKDFEEFKQQNEDANYQNNDKYREYSDAIDDLIIKYAEAERAVKEYGDAIRDLPLKELERQQGIVDSVRGFAESRNGVTEALGGQIAYKPILQADNADIGIAKGIAEQYKQRMEEAANDAAAHIGTSTEKVFDDLYEQAKAEYIDKLADVNNEIAQQINDTLEAEKQPFQALENEMTAIQNKANAVSGEVEKLIENGATGTVSQYKQLIVFNDQQIENIEKQKNQWESYRQIVEGILDLFGESKENNPLLNSIDEAINGLNEDTRQLIDSTLEYQMMLNGGIELNELSNQMKVLEKQSSAIDNQVSQLESLGQAIPIDIYKQQAQNTREQIANLRGQNEYLREQQGIVGDNKQKYEELEEQIQSNTSSIFSMLTNMNSYDDQIEHFATNTATSMSQAISNALSESVSSTGLSSDTMNQLIGQFKSIAQAANIDIGSMFKQSANGIQVNISALRKLVNAQRSMTRSNFAKQIAQQNNQLVRQVRAYKNTSNAANQDGRVKRNAAKQNLQGINAEVKALGNQINSYYAIQKMIEDQMSGYQKWQNALSTPNAGDHYKEVFSQMESITQALNTGEIGTDDFKSFFRDYVSREGRHSSQYAREQWDWIARYFTEDRTGIENFFNDLVSMGFASLSNGNYQIDVQDTEALKKSFGWTDEFLKDIFGRAEDYGIKVDYITSYADGMLQLSDSIEEVIQAQEWLSKFDNDPSMSYEGKVEWLNELINAQRSYNNIIQQMGMIGEEPFTEQEYNEAISYVNRLAQTMQEMFGGALLDDEQFGQMSEAQQLAYRRLYSEIMDIAEQYHLDLSTETFEVNVDTNSYEESLARVAQMQNYTFASGKAQLEELQKAWNTNADLDYDFINSDNLAEMQQKLQQLKELQADSRFNYETDVQAMESLSKIIESGENAVDLKIVLDTNDLTKEQFNLLTDEQKMKAIELAFETHGLDSTAQEILDYADGLEIPTKVLIDDDSIDQLGETLKTSIVDALNEAFDLGIDGSNIIGNIQEELGKIDDWKLSEYASDILSGNIQSKFGNIDMDKRAIIEWTEELKETYKKEIESWNDKQFTFNPQVGDITTVLGGSSRFGEDKLEYGVEVAFSPILQTDSGAEILNKNTLFDYIESLITDSTTDGQLNIDKMFELDAKGREVGGKFIKNVIAAVDEGIEYANNGNWAETVGRLMHFSGDFGALELEFQNLKAELEDMGLSAEDASAAVETLRNNLATVDSPDEAIKEFVESLGMPLDEANSKVDALKESLSSVGDVEVTTTVHTEGVEETVNGVTEDKNATVLIDASKSPEFDNQFTDILDEIETKEPKMNIEITSDMTQVDDIVTKIEAYDSPIIKVNIESNFEQISTDIESNGMVLSVPLDTERIKTDLTMLKTTIESENVFNIPIDGNPELLIQEIQYNKAGVESTIAYMPIDGNSELIVEEAQNDKRGIESTQANMKIGGDSRNLYTELNNDVITIERTYANIHVGANSIELFNSIQNVLNNSRFTATVDANVNATVNLTQLATGTMIAPAHAAGNVALEQDEDALVNELGTESIIRDGKWFEIPGGMHVEHLERNDVILNAQQTSQLKKYGKASGKGKIVGSESAFAEGTMKNGMPAHDSLSANGPFAPTYNLVWNPPQETLDDFQDALNDAGDGLGDAANDFSDGVDDTLEKSKQLFDYIDIRLNWLDRTATKIANRFNEWMTDLEKKTNINDQLQATMDQIDAATRAALRYSQQAHMDSVNYEYKEERTDSNGNKSIWTDYVQLNQEIPLDDLIYGKFSLEEIDTSTAKGQAIYEAAQHFMDIMGKAQAASDQVAQLSNSLGDLYSQLIQLPFDELDKSITKLERTMSSLSSIMNASASGESGIAKLNTVLSQIFGSNVAKNLIKPLANYYQTLNSQIDDNLALMKQEVEANKVAYKQAQQNHDMLEKQYRDSQAALERARSAMYNVGNSKENYEALQKEDFLDLSFYGSHDPQIKQNAMDYNKILSQTKQLEYALKESEEKIDEQYHTLQQKGADYAQALVQSVFDKLANVNTQYSSMVDYQEALNNKLKANQDYMIKWLGYMNNGKEITKSYTKQINTYSKELQATTQNLIQQKQILQEEIDAGNIIKGSKEWREAQAQIIEFETETINLKDAINEAYEAMANVPVADLEESFERIEKKYLELTKVLDSGIDSARDSQRIYQNLAQMFGKALGIETPVADLFSEYDKTYQAQNKLMVQNSNKQTDRLFEAAQDLATAKANLDYALSHRSEYTDEDIVTLEKKYDELTEAYQTELTATAKIYDENAKTAVDNIDAYFGSLISNYELAYDEIEREMNRIENSGTLEKVGAELLSVYAQGVENQNQQLETLRDQIATEEKQIAYNVKNGLWKINDENWTIAMNKVGGLKKQVDSLLSSVQQLYQSWLDMPSQIASNNISAFSNYEMLVPDENGNITIPTDKEIKEYSRDQYAKSYFLSQAQYDKVLNDAEASEQRIEEARKSRDKARGLYIKSLIDLNEKETSSSQTAQITAKDMADKIMEYYDKIISYLTSLANAYGKVRDVMDELGRALDENGNIMTDTTQITRSYTFQIDTLMEKLQEQSNKQEALKQNLDKVKRSMGENSMEYKELQKALADTQMELMDTVMELDKLKDEFREAIYFKPFEEAIEKLKELKSNLDSVNGLISEGMKLTRDGEYTQLGQVALTLDVAGYNKSLAVLQEAAKEYYENEERYANDASYSGEEYLLKQQSIREAMLQNMQDVASAREKIIQQEKNRYQTEINYIKDLINAQKDELRKRKEIADYDKNLKDKTKAIQQVEREIAALQNLNDLQSKQKLARLKAQRDELNTDLENTVQEHVLDLREQALDDLSNKMDENFETWSKDLEINIDSVIKQIDGTAEALGNVVNESNAALQTYLGTFGPNITNRMVTGLTDGLTKDGELNTPNKEEIKAAADMMVHYYDGYSAEVFDQRFAGIHDTNIAQLEEQQKRYEQAMNYEAIREGEREEDLIHQEQREAIEDSEYGQLVERLTAWITGDGGIVVGLDGNAKSIAQATTWASQELAKSNQTAIDNAASKITVSLGNMKDYWDEEMQKILDGMPQDETKDKGEGDEPYYNAGDIRIIDFDKTPSITTGTRAAVNPEVEPPTKQGNRNTDIGNSSGGSGSNRTEDFYSGKQLYSYDQIRSAEYAAGVNINSILMDVNRYKDFGFSSPRKMLNALASNKKIKPAANAPVWIKAEVDAYNKNRKNLSTAETKKLINIRIDTGYTGFKGLKKYKYASGTLSAAKGLAEVFEDGPEIITTKKGTFVPFEGGEGVIPAQQTRNLLSLAKAMQNGGLKLQMPDMSNYAPVTPAIGTVNNSNVTFESLITINGNATPETVDQIAAIAKDLVRNKQFQENVTKFVSQRQASDSRMAGKRTNIK